MTYHSILVHVDDTPAGHGRIASAAALAKRFGALMSGVFLKSEELPTYMLGDGYAVMPSENIRQFIEERDRETTKAMVAARHVFDCAARDAGVPFHWIDAVGDDGRELTACARRHDLVLLPATMQPLFGSASLSAQQVAMTNGGPVLVLPPVDKPAECGKRILFAWKETREAARALRDAWPFLVNAEEIQLFSVSRNAEELDPMLERHFRAHGCKNVRRVVDRSDDLSSAVLIRRQAAEMGADMIVLGLYGHSRLQEFVLGGVSHDLLAAPPLPLLVSH